MQLLEKFHSVGSAQLHWLRWKAMISLLPIDIPMLENFINDILRKFYFHQCAVSAHISTGEWWKMTRRIIITVIITEFNIHPCAGGYWWNSWLKIMSPIVARQHPQNTVRQISICFLFYSIICQVANLTIIRIVQAYCCWCYHRPCCRRRCCPHCLFSRVSTHFSCNRFESVYMYETNKAQEKAKEWSEATRQQATWLSFEYLLFVGECVRVSVCGCVCAGVVKHVERKLHFLCWCRLWTLNRTHFSSLHMYLYRNNNNRRYMLVHR